MTNSRDWTIGKIWRSSAKLGLHFSAYQIPGWS